MKKNISQFILIVDDDDDDRIFFCEALHEIDPAIKFIIAKDGAEALDFLSKSDVLPDFIFLDLNMPRMNGKKCLEELKKSDRFFQIPVVMYSTSKNEERSEETKKLGALAFIKKPVLFDDIREIISHVISGEWEKVSEDIYHK